MEKLKYFTTAALEIPTDQKIMIERVKKKVKIALKGRKNEKVKRP